MVSGFDDTAIIPEDLPDDPSLSLNTAAFFRETESLGANLDTSLLIRDDTTGARTAPADDSPPFLLRSRIGCGTHGEVWEAVQVALNRVVAVKRPFESSSDPSIAVEAERIFKREALTTAHLEHPNVVPTYDYGLDPDGRPVLAMKLVRGESWDKLITADQHLALEEILLKHLPVLLSIARAVAFAHSRGIVHRDIKPSQIVVGPFGEVFLADWGQAIAMPANTATDSEANPAMQYATPRSHAQSPSGTPAYMAPEQTLSSAEHTGPWTDVYLLGGILYQLLTGSPPHPQASSPEAFIHAARGEFTPPQELNRARIMPDELCALCAGAMEREIERRLSSAEQFADSIEAFLSGARRRTECLALAAEAARLLAAGDFDDERLNAISHVLNSARQLWPEEPQVLELQSQLYEQLVSVALQRGDRRLARVQGRQIPDAVRQQQALARVDIADRVAERHRRQRHIALRASLVLGTLAIVVLFSVLFYRSEQQEKKAAARREAQALLERAKTQERNSRRERDRAAINENLKELRERRNEFVDLARSSLRLPSQFDSDSTWFMDKVASRQTASLLAGQLAEMEQMRSRLSRSGVITDHGPYEFLVYLGALHFSEHTSDSLRAAYGDFATAAAAEPFEYEPRYGLALTALHLDRLDSASLHVDEAARALTFAQNLYPDALIRLRRQIAGRRAADVPLGHHDLVIEASPRGHNNDKFRIRRGTWQDTSRGDIYKSVAPGLTSETESWAVWFHFYEPYRRVVSEGVGRVEFAPGFTGVQQRHVYVTWPGNANAWPVHYCIRHAAGETTFALAQNGNGLTSRENANVWVHLGRFTFAGTPEECVSVQVGQDARPLNPQRFGMAAADAALFTSEPLATQSIEWNEVAVSPAFPGPIADVDTSPLLTIDWQMEPEAALRKAAEQGSAAFIFSYYPASSYMTHPINRNRDYCENRLFQSTAVARAVKAGYSAIKLDLARHASLARELELPADGTSIAITDSRGRAVERISGDNLLLSPPELARKLAHSSVD